MKDTNDTCDVQQETRVIRKLIMTGLHRKHLEITYEMPTEYQKVWED
jgi:hypothetical protein